MKFKQLSNVIPLSQFVKSILTDDFEHYYDTISHTKMPLEYSEWQLDCIRKYHNVVCIPISLDTLLISVSNIKVIESNNEYFMCKVNGYQTVFIDKINYDIHYDKDTLPCTNGLEEFSKMCKFINFTQDAIEHIFKFTN